VSELDGFAASGCPNADEFMEFSVFDYNDGFELGEPSQPHSLQINDNTLQFALDFINNLSHDELYELVE